MESSIFNMFMKFRVFQVHAFHCVWMKGSYALKMSVGASHDELQTITFVQSFVHSWPKTDPRCLAQRTQLCCTTVQTSGETMSGSVSVNSGPKTEDF